MYLCRLISKNCFTKNKTEEKNCLKFWLFIWKIFCFPFNVLFGFFLLLLFQLRLMLLHKMGNFWCESTWWSKCMKMVFKKVVSNTHKICNKFSIHINWIDEFCVGVAKALKCRIILTLCHGSFLQILMDWCEGHVRIMVKFSWVVMEW